MQTRQLGKSGPRVSALGFGAWPIGGGMGAVDEAAAIATVRAAIDHGLSLLDTAQAYRGSEALIGRALRDGYRARCFLASKASGDYSPAAIARACEASLRALGVDCIDLYQLHSWRADQPVEDSLAAMLALRDAGKIRFIGVSNYTMPQLERALKVAPIHAVQNRHNAFDREAEAAVLPFCGRAGVGFLSHSPLAKGLLAGGYTAATTFPPDDERSTFRRFKGEEFAAYLAVVEELKAVARDKGVTLVQLALAWLLRLPAVTCVLVGAKSPAQIAGRAAAARVVFSAAERARIETILAGAPRTPER
jgi:aryl-alcohol dehydrogenase-like predicted oxidoreductase